MNLFERIQLPDNENMNAVRRYLEAQSAKDFSGASRFFAKDVVFHGLVMKEAGREKVAATMEGFIKAAIEYIRIEAIAEVESSGGASRVMALYWFKLRPAAEPQILCDHITVKDGLIARIENVFDMKKGSLGDGPRARRPSSHVAILYFRRKARTWWRSMPLRRPISLTLPLVTRKSSLK